METKTILGKIDYHQITGIALLLQLFHSEKKSYKRVLLKKSDPRFARMRTFNFFSVASFESVQHLFRLLLLLTFVCF